MFPEAKSIERNGVSEDRGIMRKTRREKDFPKLKIGSPESEEQERKVCVHASDGNRKKGKYFPKPRPLSMREGRDTCMVSWALETMKNWY